LDIPDFTKDDYLKTEKPFQYLYDLKENKFVSKRTLTLMSDKARQVGVKNFVTLYNAYVESQKKPAEITDYDNATNFEGQELELLTGSWVADDMGITIDSPFGGEIVACVHPIMPVLRLVNIDTGVEKLKIAYKKGRSWRSTIEDRKTLSSNNSILELANKGVAVNSENSKYRRRRQFQELF